MEIKQFKDFEKGFVFPGILEERALLEKVRKNTFSDAYITTCNKIENRLLDSNRPKTDKESIILIAYVLYVCSFTSGLYSNFDKICERLAENPYTYMGEITLKEMLRN